MSRSSHGGLAALLAVLACAACSHGAPVPSDAAAPDAPSAAPSAEPTAAAEPARCIDDDHADVPAPGGARATVTCGADSVCLGGACAPLKLPSSLGASALDRGQLLRFTGEGWLSAWTLLGPYDRPTVDSFVKAPSAVFDSARNSGARGLCAEAGRIDVKPRGGGHALLAGLLVSARPQRAWLKAGVSGKLRVWVAGDKVTQPIDVARSQGLDPLPDETVEPVELAAGPNLVLIDLESAGEGPPSLWVRVHDDRQALPADIAFAPALASAACSAANLVDLSASRALADDGLDIDFTAKVAGLWPRRPEKIPYKIELKAKKPVPVTEGEMTSSDLEAGPAIIKAHAAPGKDGKQTVRVILGDKEERLFAMHQRKKLFPRIIALQKALAALPESVPRPSRESFTRDVEEIARAAAEGHSDDSWLRGRLEGAESLAEAFAAGQDAYKTKTGVVFRAYRSELDGELQPYVAYVPPSHKPDGAPLPMIVSFHGLTHQGEHALRAVIGEATKEDENPDWSARHLPAFPSSGAILVAPWGYGKAGPKQLGEHDILRVIDEMKASYRVDASRVSITGYSLGGTVAFALPLHYPSVFSAAAPLCGYPNLTTYQSVKDVRHMDWEDAMIARRFLGNYTANGMYVPMNIVHGKLDGPQRSQVIADRYKALGYSRIFDVQDDLGHNVWDYAYKDQQMIAWLKKKQQPRPPGRVRLVTGEYRYDRSYWVRLIGMDRSPGVPGSKVDKIDQPDSFADIDAQMDFPAKELRITTKNVTSFAVDGAGLGLQKGTVAKVDGVAIPIEEVSKEVFFERGANGWALAASEPSREGKKRAGVSGPLDDVLRHPQLIVYGTQDPSQTETNRLVAQHFSSADQWSSAHFPIKADRDVTEAELTGRSLVLIGGPSSNRVTAMFAASLPVQFDGKAIVLRGKRHEGDDVGVSFIYPHPRDNKEYVVVHAGTTFRGTLWSRHLPQLAPDFLVYDRRMTAMRGELLLDRRQALAGGFFDEEWR